MKWFVFFALASAVPVFAQVASAPKVGAVEEKSQSVKLTARASRSDAVYHKGEPVKFVIHLERNGAPMPDSEVSWNLTKDGLPMDQSGKVVTKNGVAEVSGKLDEPGFLQLRVSYKDSPKSVISAMGGAGIDPTDIKPSRPVTEDFDAFWTAQKKRLAAIPLNPKLEEVKSPSKTLQVFDIKADSVDSQISGYFAKPLGAKPKSLPIVMTVHGAGVRSSSLGGAAGWAAKEFLAMDMNAHGIPNGKPDEFYKDLTDNALKDYRYVGRDSREKCYFLGMYLRLIRGIDFLTSQPEWDGKTVIVYGGSQGGAQAFAAAGLDERVTFFCAAVPAMSDHTGMVAGRIAGWPKLVPTVDGKPDPKVLEVSRYFDDVNMATRTKALGAYVTTGFIDTTCPPSSVYAAYNNLKIEKHIWNDIEYGHPYSKEASESMMKAALDFVKGRRLK